MNSYSKKLEGTKLDGFKILFLKEHKSLRRMSLPQAQIF